MSISFMNAKRPAAPASTDRPGEVAGSALQRHVAKTESRVTAGAEAVRFEIAQLTSLIGQLLEPPPARPSPGARPRSVSAPADAPAADASTESSPAVGSENTRLLPCREPEYRRSALRAALDGDVHRLHELLRRLSAESDGLPDWNGGAPGYYAVYFTDDGSGFAVEYVDVRGPGGDS